MTPRKFLAAFLIGSLFATGAMAQGRQTENRSAYDPAVDAQRVVIRSSTGSAAPAGTTGDPVAVQGNVASAQTDSGNPVKIGCYAMSTAPTAVTNGQREDVWCGLRGQLAIVQTDMAGNLTTLRANNAAIASSGATVFPAGLSLNFCWDGAQWILASACPSSATAAGLAAVTGVSSTGIVLKASAGNVYDLSVVAPASAGYVQLLNLTAVPADATTNTPIWCMPLAASAGLDKTFAVPRVASTGAVLLFSSTACGASLTKVAAPYLAGAAK